MNEKIHAVALLGPDNVIHTLPQPARHVDILWKLRDMTEDKFPSSYCINSEQGFITNFGRFVDRSEAMIIALRENQLIHKPFQPAHLFSEDLW